MLLSSNGKILQNLVFESLSFVVNFLSYSFLSQINFFYDNHFHLYFSLFHSLFLSCIYFLFIILLSLIFLRKIIKLYLKSNQLKITFHFISLTFYWTTKFIEKIIILFPLFAYHYWIKFFIVCFIDTMTHSDKPKNNIVWKTLVIKIHST